MVTSIPQPNPRSQMDSGGKRVVLFQERGCARGAPVPTLWHTCGCAPAHVGRDHRSSLMALGAQEEEDRDESGCEEEEGREDEDEDSGSEESLVDSDSDPEEKGACAWAGAGAWGGASRHRQTQGCKTLSGRSWSGDRPPSPQISETVGI